MTTRQTPRISSRKQPQQARSTELVAAILEAAIQVLAKEGASRFTTARVAEKAGVSVGSVYQYFPNKAAILFRLQSDEWQQTTQMLRDILDETEVPALTRLRTLVHAFIHSECEEALMRVALNDAAPLYRLDQGTEVTVAGEQHHLVDMRCDLHGIDRKLDVHVALDLAAAGLIDEFLGRFGDDGIAVVVEPIDQRPDR